MLAKERGEWAGIPMPIDDFQLIVEPTYPKAKELMSLGAAAKEEDLPESMKGWKVRNVWYSHKRRCDIYMIERNDGRLAWGLKPAFHHITHDLNTLGASDVWGIEQEAAAIRLLAEKTRHRQFKQYMLTGMFLERSKRSGVTYMFRRLKPTVALAARPGLGEAKHGGMNILASLCMHPIAYYAGSWAGAMCPTDDVIAHLMMMRGDEIMFWKRCNQHPPYRPEAGL